MSGTKVPDGRYGAITSGRYWTVRTPMNVIDSPAELRDALREVAGNLWFSWLPGARDLFARLDAERFAALDHNPTALLAELSDDELWGRVDRERLDHVRWELAQERERRTWWQRREEDARLLVAYFSCEFGLDESLPIYSGGLGILSGDHLKSASDLGVPLVAVGLLYKSGYFQQTVDADGRQQHSYPEYDFTRLPVRPAASPTGRDVLISVPVGDREIKVKVWVAQVGRVPLLLLDTDIPDNDPADRPVTSTLYVQGRAMRLVQEIVLGIGGVRALQACGVEPHVWHINEG